MSMMTPYQPQVPMPRQLRQHLKRQSAHTDYYHHLAIQALDAESNLYSYAVWKVVSSVATATRLKGFFAPGGRHPELDAWFQEFTQTYMDEVAQVPKRVCHEILLILEATPPPPNDGGLLQELIAVFRNY